MAEEPHEPSTLSVRGVLIGAAGIALSVLITLLAAHALLEVFRELPPVITGKPFTRTAGPALEVSPREDLEKFRAEERRKIEQYRLVEEQKGVVQIPIERAMTLLAAEHDAKAAAGQAEK